MATGTVTHALRKLYKAIVGQDIAKNNPTKIINDLADNWPDGITVEALSVTENGTYTAQEGKAYTPVTVNVSGGSSDFSTATVTIVNTNGNANLDFYGIVDNSYAQALLKSDGDYLVSHSWIGETDTTAEFLMIQNSFMIAIPMYEPTITGSASKEYLSEYSEWDVTITGDCTITIG